MKNKSTGYSFYKFLYALVFLPFKFLYRTEVVGLENVPDGGAVICANHSNWVDPFLIVYSVRRKHYIHFMAKIELFKNKIFGCILRGLDMIPVKRDGTDINSVKLALTFLRRDEKLGIFPEGTRLSEDFSAAAKSGAIKIAEKSGKPIIPVHIPRKKKMIKKIKIVIGKPYYINPERKRLSPEEYDGLAQDLMVKIKELDLENA